MKLSVKFMFLSMVFMITIFCFSITINAHTDELSVVYDACEGDGENSIWYYLTADKTLTGEEIPDFMCHFYDSNRTIKFYISDTAKNDSTISWDYQCSTSEASQIISDLKNSMYMWNDIYYYKYSSEGDRFTYKVITLEETTNKYEANIVIYPMYDDGYAAPIEKVEPIEFIEQRIEMEQSGIFTFLHGHSNTWELYVNLRFVNPCYEDYNEYCSFVGAHEIGHVLGLQDIDTMCELSIHHNEVIMGYEIDNHVDYITYQDIAGVSITQGFHTDDDHVWMKRNNNNGTIDLICAQCNGVLYDIEMDSNGTTYQGKSVNIYKNCIHHNGTASNMLLVATDGDRDFFKCQNCRHIESVEINDEYTINNNSQSINELVSIGSNSSKFYVINSTNNKRYEIMLTGNNNINFKLYDDKLNEIIINDLSSYNNVEHVIVNLDIGKYYLEVINNANTLNSINIKINSTFPSYLNIGNNIVSDYIFGIEDYVYINNNSAGFYKITLNATNSSGTIDYPEGCIKVYADEAKQQMLARLETIFYTLDAETQGDSNNVIVFLEYGESYYINIDLPSASYSSMYINIERLTNTYDIIESNNAEEHVILNENTTAYGDYIQRVEIHEAGTYTISFVHNGPQSEENLMGQEDPLYLYYAFYKEVYSPAEQFGDLEMIFPHIASSMGGTISFTFNLQPGVYYIGYYNKLNNEPMSISITS